MFKTITTFAIATLLVSPAMAATGRVEMTAGVQDVTNAPETNDVTYGATIGMDADILGPIFVGVQASVDNVLDNRNLGAGARVGAHVTDKLDVYAVGSYANYTDAFSRDLDGLRVGGGIEYKVLGPVYAGLEYSYSDFAKNVGQHGGKVKVGLKF